MYYICSYRLAGNLWSVTFKSNFLHTKYYWSTVPTGSVNLQRDVNCIKSHKKRITCQIKAEPLVTSALFTLNHIFFPLPCLTHTHTHTQRRAYGVISVAIQTALYVFVLMQICRLLVFIFTLTPTLVRKHSTGLNLSEVLLDAAALTQSTALEHLRFPFNFFN